MVFLEKKNITKWEYLEAAAKTAGLNVAQFKTDYEGKAKELFQKDLELGRELGVRGFPTIFFTDKNGKTEKVYGSKPYVDYENAIRRLEPNIERLSYAKDLNAIFSKYPSLTAKEFSELTGIPRNEAEKVLDESVVKGELEKLTTKNGSIWRLTNNQP